MPQPYSEQAWLSPTNVQRYLVLADLTRQPNIPMFAERAATQDSPKLRKHLRAHVFNSLTFSARPTVRICSWVEQERQTMLRSFSTAEISNH
jgi:hypothetical protein